MNTLPEDYHFGFVSPLAPHLARFLALKRAMGYRYREEGAALRDLDCFLNSRLPASDPLITPAIVHDYVARRGAESETTRTSSDAHPRSMPVFAARRCPHGCTGSPILTDCAE